MVVRQVCVTAPCGSRLGRSRGSPAAPARGAEAGQSIGKPSDRKAELAAELGMGLAGTHGVLQVLDDGADQIPKVGQGFQPFRAEPPGPPIGHVQGQPAVVGDHSFRGSMDSLRTDRQHFKHVTSLPAAPDPSWIRPGSLRIMRPNASGSLPLCRAARLGESRIGHLRQR
jgi:hypothetical protein